MEQTFIRIKNNKGVYRDIDIEYASEKQVDEFLITLSKGQVAAMLKKALNVKESVNKHLECKYCDGVNPVHWRGDKKEPLVCGGCGAEWEDAKILVED